jgi:hypothetical protein
MGSMINKAWFAIGFAILTQPVLANGGGYFRGGVERAGDVAGFEPKETEKIRILDEKLTVALGPKSADVEVRYLMRNETDKKVKVRFGFPVEESFDNVMGEIQPGTETDKLRYCQNYVITASGKPIAAKWQVEKKSSGDKRFKGIVGWLISEITFAAGEEKPVMIHFQSGYPFASVRPLRRARHCFAIVYQRLPAGRERLAREGSLLNPPALIRVNSRF